MTNLENLRKICADKNILLKKIDYPLKWRFVFFKDCNIIIVASNATEKHIDTFIQGEFFSKAGAAV